MTENEAPRPTREALRDSVAGLLGVSAAAIADDANLAALGLSSLQLMQLINQWRREGLTVAFRDFATDPTIEVWSRRLEEARG